MGIKGGRQGKRGKRERRWASAQTRDEIEREGSERMANIRRFLALLHSSSSESRIAHRRAENHSAISLPTYTLTHPPLQGSAAWVEGISSPAWVESFAAWIDNYVKDLEDPQNSLYQNHRHEM